MKASSPGVPSPERVKFEPEFVAQLKTLFEELIVFNRTLGLQITEISPGRAKARLAMRPELIGHHGHQRLHGGVVSATLDAIGGLAVMAAIGARHMDEPWRRAWRASASSERST